jgi:hypothetical protein
LWTVGLDGRAMSSRAEARSAVDGDYFALSAEYGEWLSLELLVSRKWMEQKRDEVLALIRRARAARRRATRKTGASPRSARLATKARVGNGFVVRIARLTAFA